MSSQTNFYQTNSEGLHVIKHRVLDNGSILTIYAKYYENALPAYSRFVFTLYNECGEQEWAVTPDISGNETLVVYRIFIAPDDSIILFASEGGSTPSPTLIKLSADGDFLWSKTYHMQAAPRGVTIAFKDNYIYFLSRANSINAGSDIRRFFLVKLDNEGEIIWKKRLFVPVQTGDVYIDEEGYFIFTSHKKMSKISFEGEVIFTKKYFIAGNEEGAHQRYIANVSNLRGGYYMVLNNSNVLGSFMTKTDKMGNILWTSPDLTGLYGTQDTLYSRAMSLSQDSENNIYLFSQIYSSPTNNNYSRFNLSKIDSETGNISYRKDIYYENTPPSIFNRIHDAQFLSTDTSFVYTGRKILNDETEVFILGKIRLNDFEETDCYYTENIETDDFIPEVVSVLDTAIVDSMNMFITVNDFTLKPYEIDDNLLCTSFTDYEITIDSLSTCGNNPIILDATTIGATVEYNWSDGTNLSTIEVIEPGNYQVEITVCGSKRLVTYKVGLSDACRCEFEFPNVFTPNGDGINDTFAPIGDCNDLGTYSFTIYSRWGEVIFESKNQQESWNGELKGRPVPADVYVYTFEYQGLSGQNEVQDKIIGDFTLIR